MSEVIEAPPAAAPPAAAPPAAPPAPPPPEQTALGAAPPPPAAPPAAAPPPAPPSTPFEHIPEKYRVSKADGTPDLEASAVKLAEAHGHLERRMGAGEAPPKSADDYKVNVPEALAERIKAEDLAKDAGFKEFLGQLHGAGLNQAQVDVAVAAMLSRGEALRAGSAVMSRADCVATLQQIDGWKSPAEYEAHRSHAATATTAYMEKAGVTPEQFAKSGLANNPVYMRLMAAIGPELAEDRQVNATEAAALSDSLAKLQGDPAFLNANHPRHAEVVAKVTALTQQQVGTRPIEGGMTMSFKSG